MYNSSGKCTVVVVVMGSVVYRSAVRDSVVYSSRADRKCTVVVHSVVHCVLYRSSAAVDSVAHSVVYSSRVDRKYAVVVHSSCGLCTVQ